MPRRVICISPYDHGGFFLHRALACNSWKAGARVSAFRARAAEDLRHVRKHAARYACQGEGGRKLTGGQRGLVARVWMKTGKPLYNWLTRRVLKRRDGEPKRPKSGPWPEWGEPVGPWG